LLDFEERTLALNTDLQPHRMGSISSLLQP
jgi:hypothetical protein